MSRRIEHNELANTLALQLEQSDRVVIQGVGIGSKYIQGSIPIPDVMMFKKSYNKPDITIFEIKSYRGDFTGDVNKGKYRRYFDICNRLYFAVPAGMVKMEEVPQGVGLWVYNDKTNNWSAQKAAKRNEIDLGRYEWFSVMFSLNNSQIRMRELKERLVMKENTKLSSIAKDLPYKFHDMLKESEDVVKEFEGQRDRMCEILGIDKKKWGQWHDIERQTIKLVKQTDFSKMKDVKFALKILEEAAGEYGGGVRQEEIDEFTKRFDERKAKEEK